jgi:D-alanyl-D-alanine carboxypeptidase (penicillin-binding protein 5/6)
MVLEERAATSRWVRPPSPERAALAAGVASMVLFFWFALVTPPGLPYDEPSHFGTVQHYAEHHSMPEMGDDGVTYEAQNGPVYYATAAVSYRVADAVGSRSFAFDVTRVAGAIAWGATLWLTYVCVSRLLGRVEGAASVALVGLNPAILAVVSSVQNDGLAIALCVGGLAIALTTIESRELRVPVAAAFGALVGVAALTKLHSAVVLGVAFIVMVVAAARDRARVILAGAATAALVTAWWFVRNVHLYGDLTGRAGVRRTGVDFPAEELSPGGLWRFGRGVFGYLWTPAEYYRNLVDTPVVFELAAIALSLAAVIGLVRSRPRFTTTGAAMTVIAAVFCVTLAALYFTVSTLAGRLLYPLAPLYAAALILGFRGWGPRGARALVAATIVVQVSLSIVMLRDLASLPTGPWAIAL